MEIRYPLILIIGLIIIVLFFIFKPKSKVKKYCKEQAIANLEYLKITDLYKKKLDKYQKYKKILNISLVIMLVSSAVLLSRLTYIDTVVDNKYNRDIMLCMDVSKSVFELDSELADNLIDTVKRLKQERIGITIFNSSSVLAVPLTDDYNYVIESLTKIKKGINDYNNDLTTEDVYFLLSGVSYSNGRGSSLIGEGLASCTYNFDDEDRTKIIIFSTDNDLEGTPLITLEKAIQQAKNNKIIVYGIGTNNITHTNEEEFKKAVEIAGGNYFKQSEGMTNIVKEIENQSKSLLKGHEEKVKTDIPFIPFIILLASSASFIYVSRRLSI